MFIWGKFASLSIQMQMEFFLQIPIYVYKKLLECIILKHLF